VNTARSPSRVEVGSDGLIADPWLSEICGMTCFRSSDDLALLSPSGIEQALKQAGTFASAFVTAKVPTTEVAAATRLTRGGFAIVDTGITLQWQKTTAHSRHSDGIDIAKAGPEQAEAAGSLAAKCFTYSRFHLDPLFPDRLANEIKSEWSANSCRGLRGAGVYAAAVDGQIAGFLAVATSGPPDAQTAVIDLIGVAAGHQGKGVGRALVSAFLVDWAPRSAAVKVGTQAANTASLLFYESLGFRFSQSNYVLHAHVLNGEILLC
jgi:dTDP-4-amino-4,6-dideoxy-D-galactose acyltransferase